MTTFNSTIIGSVNFGGGLTTYTTYTIQIIHNNVSWLIYRRYSDFESLHQTLVDNPPNQMDTSQLIQSFPKKVIGGSFAGTFKSIVLYRTTSLQIYLKILFTLQPVDELLELPFIQKFFDLTHQGMAGVVIQVGTNKVVLDALARVKIIKNLMGIWSYYFVVLLKDGTLCIMNSIYDEMANAILNINVTNDEIYFVPRAARNTLDITMTSLGVRVILQLTSMEAAANWSRSISDMIIKNDDMTTNQKDNDVIRGINKKKSTSFSMKNESKDDRINRNSSSSLQNASILNSIQMKPTVQHIKSKGTGNTHDELSDIYGI